MEWYATSPERMKLLKIRSGENLKDEDTLYEILLRSKVVDGSFDREDFNKALDRALREKEMPDYDYTKMLKDVENFMTQLGIMPFDESKLPPEDPSTF